MIDTGKTVVLGLLTIGTILLLMAVRIFVGLVGNSYALVADGIESGADIFTSLVT